MTDAFMTAWFGAHGLLLAVAIARAVLRKVAGI